MGAGGIGLMLVQLAVWRARPVSRSLTYVEEKCELAKQLGADYAY